MSADPLAIDFAGTGARVVCFPDAVPHAMSVSEFPILLSHYMRRIRASAAGMASEIGMSREAVNNWRHGDSLPSRKHRDKVLASAVYLRLSESETDALLAAAGFDVEFPTEVTPALPTAVPAIAPIFDRLQSLRPYPILMLLTQAHLGQPPHREAMLDEARRRYGADAVLHLQPPFSLQADTRNYFAAIAAQCGMSEIDSDYAFEAALARRLQTGGQLFCLVSRFEQGDPQQRDVLAGILRSLSEMHSGRLHLLICGGAALADLKYRGGDLSLLNIATAEQWPELSVHDVVAMAQHRRCVDVDAARVLRVAGGHPLLTDAALTLLAERGSSITDDEMIATLAMHPPLWQSLLPLLADAASRAAIATWLTQARIGPARPYLIDPMLRNLYWSNLVVARHDAAGAWLEWRCAAIRDAAAAILEQVDGAS